MFRSTAFQRLLNTTKILNQSKSQSHSINKLTLQSLSLDFKTHKQVLTRIKTSILNFKP